MTLFFITFLSIIDSFNVFSYNNVIKFIQSLSLVYSIFNFEMYSFVMRIARDVIKMVELVIITPILGFSNDIVEVPIADPDPAKISVTIKRIFFLFKLLYLFLSFSLSASRLFNTLSKSCFSV